MVVVMRRWMRRRWDVSVQLQSLNLQPDLAPPWLKARVEGCTSEGLPALSHPPPPH